MGAQNDLDSAVMRRSAEQPEAFGAIFDRHAATILRFLVRRTGPSTAEGLLGETFRIAFERRDRFDPAWESARPWLYGIASKLLLKQRRTEARRVRAMITTAAMRETEAAGADPGQADDTRRALEAVAEGLLLLPDDEREALLLFAWEDLGYAEIAAAQGVPVGTVRSRIHRARQRLREPSADCGKERDDAGPNTRRTPR